jgi:phosphonoacetaldehyde hydrolase
VGIQAAKNAGAYAVAVSQTGNGLGLSREEVTALPAEVLEQRLALIEREFRAAGADAVIRSVADLPSLVDALAHAAGSITSGSRTS